MSQVRAHAFFSLFMLSIALIGLTTSFERMTKRMIGEPSGAFAFVFDPVEEGRLADTLRNTGVFTAVFEVGEQDARDLCERLARDVVSTHQEWMAEVCLNTPWVLVTHSVRGEALAFINGSAGVTSELVELLATERFFDGFIDVYNGTEHVGHVQGYTLKRVLFVFPVWEPVGVGAVVNRLVGYREADMYEANGIPWRSFRNVNDVLKLMCVVTATVSFILYVRERRLSASESSTPVTP